MKLCLLISALFCMPSIWWHVFHISVLFVGDFTISNGPEQSAEVLSNDPQCQKAVMCLTEIIHV